MAIGMQPPSLATSCVIFHARPSTARNYRATLLPCFVMGILFVPTPLDASPLQSDSENRPRNDQWLTNPWLTKSALPDMFDLADEVGNGRFSIVRRLQLKVQVNGECQMAPVQWACKSINKDKSNAEAAETEIRAMCLLSSAPHIAAVHNFFEDSQHVHIVMELCEGDSVYQRLPEYGFAEDVAARIFRSLVTAVTVCHDKGVIHFDIKSDNMLLCLVRCDFCDESFYEVKLSDFGVAKVLRAGETEVQINKLRGTYPFMSPEAVNGGFVSRAADIYSMGATLYDLLTGRIPGQKGPRKTSEWPKTCRASEQAKEFTNLMMSLDPSQRPSVDEILASDWVQNADVAPLPDSLVPLQPLYR